MRNVSSRWGGDFDVRQYEDLIRKHCLSFIRARPRFADDFLQIGRMAAIEASIDFKPGLGRLEARIATLIKWRCIHFYHQNKIFGISMPFRNLGNKAPKMYSLDALEYEEDWSGNDEDEETPRLNEHQLKQIKDFLNSLEGTGIYDYAVLAFKGASPSEIRAKLNLNKYQQSLLQQRFKGKLDRYFNPKTNLGKRKRAERLERLRQSA